MSRWRCWSLAAAAVTLGPRARSGRAGAGELATPLAGARLGCGARVVLLPGLEGGQGALVAHDHQAGEPEHERGDAGQADPAAVDGAGGGVLDGGVEPLGRG